MSEITKVCETCNDTRKVSSDAWEAPPVPCPDCCEEPEKVCGRCGGSGEQDDGCCVRCGGHGTVVDVQAQLDSARIMCERLESALRGKESENAESRAEVARLTNELGAEQAFHRSTKLSLSDERTSRQYWEREADTDHRAAAQLSAKAEAHARDMERRVTYALTKAEAEVTRLTATLAERDGEVARLEGREREVAVMLVEWNADANGYAQCPTCTGDVSIEAPNGGPHRPGCERLAWLAGCKS